MSGPAAAGRELGPGEGRAYHVNIHVAGTTEAALTSGRDGHDEYVKFLSPYGRFKHYRGGEVPFDHRPPIEETMAEETMAIGSVEQVADQLGRFADRMGFQRLLLFPDFPGLTRAQIDEQMHLIADEVLPRIGVRAPGRRSLSLRGLIGGARPGGASAGSRGPGRWGAPGRAVVPR